MFFVDVIVPRTTHQAQVRADELETRTSPSFRENAGGGTNFTAQLPTMLRTNRICLVLKSSTQHSKTSVRPSPGGSYLRLLEGRQCCTCLLRRHRRKAHSSKRFSRSFRIPVWAFQISASVTLVGYAADKLVSGGDTIHSVHIP